MKNKIAFVAVGQAGGNIGRLFEQKGFSVLYVNTSQEDLDTLDHAKFKHHITGGEGCNNRFGRWADVVGSVNRRRKNDRHDYDSSGA